MNRECENSGTCGYLACNQHRIETTGKKFDKGGS